MANAYEHRVEGERHRVWIGGFLVWDENAPPPSGGLKVEPEEGGPIRLAPDSMPNSAPPARRSWRWFGWLR
jgi:hypothetical protein